MGLDRKKRIGVHAAKRFIAGSPWNLEKTQKPPQAPPAGIRVELRAAEIKPPRCQHGVQLTKEEFEANNYEFGRLNKNERPTSFDTVLLRSSTCLRCSPQCEHGQSMSKAEVAEAIKSGKRYSPQCAACTGSEKIEDWERVLKFYGLGAGRGMSPAKQVVTKPDGSTHFLGQGRNFETSGDIERQDATSTIARDDMPARSRKPGHGIDGDNDEGQAVFDEAQYEEHTEDEE